MPFIAAPIIGFLASLGGATAAAIPTLGEIVAGTATAAGIAETGVSLGEKLAGTTGGGSSGPSVSQQAQQQATTAAANNASTQAQDKAAIARQYPNLQEQLGGALAPDYNQSQAAIQAGDAGDTNIGRQAWQQFLGDKNLVNTDNIGTVGPGGNQSQGSSDFLANLQLPGFGGSSDNLQASGGNV